MQSPWQTGFHDPKVDYDVRSTSAPPPETSFWFQEGGGVGGCSSSRKDGMDANSILGSEFALDDRPLHSSLAFTEDSLFSHSGHSGNRRSPAPPGFARSDYLASATTETRHEGVLSSSLPRHGMETNDTNGLFLGLSFNRQAIGDNLVRSHSAAPSFDGGMSMGPPPGLARRETPLISNRSSGNHPMASSLDRSSKDSYLENSMDRSHVLQMAQRRPASTGVIGGSHQSSSTTSVLNSLGLGGSGGAVRPSAKTLMDLIQEDFPPDSTIDKDFYGNEFTRESVYALERPRTTSPLSSQYNNRRSDSYHYTGQDDYGFLDFPNQTRLGVGEHPLPQQNKDSDQANLSQPYVVVVSNTQQTEQIIGTYPAMPSHPQLSRPQPQHPRHLQPQIQSLHHNHHQVLFEQQNRNYGTHQSLPLQSHIHAQVLPSGHTVYVNAPSPQNYHEYATIHYHPHTQQHHVVHARHPNEQYISVVPIQGGSHMQGAGPGGTYTYWQPPDGQQGGPQTVTILPPGAGVVPASMTRVGNGQSCKSPNHRQNNQQRNSHSGRGKEKGKRNCGSTLGRRGGGGASGGGVDSKSQPTNGTYPAPSLLDEYKSKKNNRDWSVHDIKGNVVDFCKDQNGSRFIQQRLEIGDGKEKETVIDEVLPDVESLRNDVFGNYVVQKLFDLGSDKMKQDLCGTLTGEIVPLSMEMYGCRVVQKALECVDESDLPKLLSEFRNNVLTLIHDQNGNHVIQKCIEVLCQKAKDAHENPAELAFYKEQLEFIVDDIHANAASLSCHPYGCRVVQRILEFCQDPNKSMTLDEISKCHRTLLDDQYGNYVLQHVLEFGRTQDRDMILKMVIENGLLKLSRQKFASNVVEKLLKFGNADQRQAVVREMLQEVDEATSENFEEGTSSGTSVVLLMVRDAYANYVVQTALDVISDSDEKANLLKELNAHLPELKNYTFAKHIMTKLS